MQRSKVSDIIEKRPKMIEHVVQQFPKMLLKKSKKSNSFQKFPDFLDISCLASFQLIRISQDNLKIDEIYGSFSFV